MRKHSTAYLTSRHLLGDCTPTGTTPPAPPQNYADRVGHRGIAVRDTALNRFPSSILRQTLDFQPPIPRLASTLEEFECLPKQERKRAAGPATSQSLESLGTAKAAASRSRRSACHQARRNSGRPASANFKTGQSRTQAHRERPRNIFTRPDVEFAVASLDNPKSFSPVVNMRAERILMQSNLRRHPHVIVDRHDIKSARTFLHVPLTQKSQRRANHQPLLIRRHA